MWLGSDFIIAVQRNGIVRLGFTLEDSQGAIDLTGYTVYMKISRQRGDFLVKDLPCENPNLASGKFDFAIDGRDFTLIEGRRKCVFLSFNIVATDTDGPIIIGRGLIKLEPGVPV